MAIAHGSTDSAESSGTSSLDIASFTVTGTNKALVVRVAYKSAGAGAVNRVTWDKAGVGEALTMVGNEVGSSNSKASLYVLAAPTSKTAILTVDFTKSVRCVVGVSCYTGVHQGAPFRTASSADNTGNDDSPTVDVVALATEMVIDSMCQVSAGPDTVTANDHTLRYSEPGTGGGTDVRGASQDVISSGATETMGWTLSSSDDWGITACALQEPSVDATRLQVNISDTWETIESIQINIGDVWKDVTGAQINISDDWKAIYSN